MISKSDKIFQNSISEILARFPSYGLFFIIPFFSVQHNQLNYNNNNPENSVNFQILLH